MTDGPLSPDAFLRLHGEEIPEVPRLRVVRPRPGDGAALAAFLAAPHWLERELEPPEPLLGEAVTNTTRMFIGGPTGLGKTHLGMAMAACMAVGKDFLHWQASRRCRVLYVDGEMPRDLVQERTADLHRRMPGADLSGLFILCREDCEELAERFPTLGEFKPLNTPEGQAFLLRLVELLGSVDAVFFDNRMSLLAGDMKEELPWTDTMPLVKELTRRRIAQVWLDHTGHNTGQLYGTKTKEWQFDAVALLTKAEQPGVDIAFTLEFTKARRRKPANRADFETVTLAMVEDEWRVEGAQAAPHGKLNDEAVSLLRHVTHLLASGQGGPAHPEPGIPAVPTLPRKAVLHPYLVRRGWFVTPETELRSSGQNPGSEEALPECNGDPQTPGKLRPAENSYRSVSDKEWKRLNARLTTLQNKGLLGFNRHSVWLIKPVAMP